MPPSPVPISALPANIRAAFGLDEALDSLSGRSGSPAPSVGALFFTPPPPTLEGHPVKTSTEWLDDHIPLWHLAASDVLSALGLDSAQASGIVADCNKSLEVFTKIGLLVDAPAIQEAWIAQGQSGDIGSANVRRDYKLAKLWTAIYVQNPQRYEAQSSA